MVERRGKEAWLFIEESFSHNTLNLPLRHKSINNRKDMQFIIFIKFKRLPESVFEWFYLVRHLLYQLPVIDLEPVP